MSNDTLPPPETLRLWNDVACNLKKSGTVVWRAAVDSVEGAKLHWATSAEARDFCHENLELIVGIMVEQRATHIGPTERQCVEGTLQAALELVWMVLEEHVNGNNNSDFRFWKTLGLLLQHDKNYYSNRPILRGPNSGMPPGKPAFFRRLMMANDSGGLVHLNQYLQQEQSKQSLSLQDVYNPCLHHILQSVCSVLRFFQEENTTDHGNTTKLVLVAVDLCQTVKAWVLAALESADDGDNIVLSEETLSNAQTDLQQLWEIAGDHGYRGLATETFPIFWRQFAELLLSQKQRQLCAWKQVLNNKSILKATPQPAKAYIVQGAGADVCNGCYDYAGPWTPDGYIPRYLARSNKPGSGLKYTRQAGRKTLTLFQCTTRSQNKWWYISEPDPEQPGTDRDIDYYHCKCEKPQADDEEAECQYVPPPIGWVVCKPNGEGPPPSVQPEENHKPNSQQHELALWALENKTAILSIAQNEAILVKELQDAPFISFLEHMQSNELPALGTLVSQWKTSVSARAEAAEVLFGDSDDDDDDDAYMFDPRGDLRPFQGLVYAGGDTGYMDVILHQLYLYEPFRRLILSQKGARTSPDSVPGPGLIALLVELFESLENGSDGDVVSAIADRFVDACGGALNLEYGVREQNDAGQFATMLLDRIDSAFTGDDFKKQLGLGFCNQKVCRSCNQVTGRSSELLSLDVRVRGFSKLEESLASLAEEEVMEGPNRVYCSKSCQRNTDHILRGGLDAAHLPDLLQLRLKRFDLDRATFQTVKLNSHFEFPKRLDLAPYCVVNGNGERKAKTTYRLKGVVIHDGTAHGGYVYSLVRIGKSGTAEERWLKICAPKIEWFNYASLGAECFGGKVKKDVKWPNGQVHTVEQEQTSNAMMLFYEKGNVE